MSKVTLVCGQKHSGKSTFVRTNLPTKRRVIPFDPRHEYKETDLLKPFYGTSDQYIKYVEHLTQVCLIYEEATSYWSNRTYSEETNNKFIACFHERNEIFIIYHSLRSIPIGFLENIDYLVLFRTKDNPTVVNTKYNDYPEIIETFNKIQTLTNPSNFQGINVIKKL